jgi:DNA replication initiation complex subunit (GINS family)
MDIKSLREIHRKERMSPYLQDVGKEFFQELKDFYNRKIQKVNGGKSNFIAIKELDNIKTIINDLFEIRERKIVSNALYYVKSGEEIELENLTTDEEQMLNSIINEIREHRKILDTTLSTKYNHPPHPEEKQLQIPLDKKPKQTEPQIEKNASIKRITIRILKDLPSIIGADGKFYGNFKKEDVVTLPEPNAEVFIKQAVAEKIDQNAYI